MRVTSDGSSDLPNMASLLRTSLAVFLEDKATVFSERWAVTLLRHHTLLFFFFLLDKAGCHAKQQLSFGKQAKTAPPSRRRCLLPSLANERGSSPARRRKAAKGELEGGRKA